MSSRRRRVGWVPRLLATALLVGGAGSTPFLSGPMANARVADRSTSDRPDDHAGSQVHAIYVVPSDGVDRSFDTDGTIAASVSNFEAWLRNQTGGPGLRLDTYQGQLDVSFFRLAESDASVAA